MSFVLVLTVASLALADAGYQYNVPGAFGLPGNQPANFQPGHTSQHHISLPNEPDRSLSHSISYKDYVYLKQDNVHQNNGNHGSANYAATNNGIAASPSIQLSAGPGYHNGNVNLHNNFAQISPQVNHNFNSGHIQNFSPSINGNVNSGYSNTQPESGYNTNIGYAHNSVASTGGLNTRYVQTSTASAATHLDNGNAHVTASAVTNNFIGGNFQTFTPSANANLNTVYSYDPAPSTNAGLNQGFANAGIQSASSNFNSGYSQTLTPSDSASLSNGYSVSSDRSKLNTANFQTLSLSGTPSISSTYSGPSTSENLINGYSQAVVTSGNANLYNSYSQTSVSSASSNQNNGHLQAPVQYSSPSSTSQGYAQTSITSGGGNINTGYYQTSLPPGSASSTNTGYPSTSIPSVVSGINNYNTGYSHSFSLGTDTRSNEFAQTAVLSASSNLNTGYSPSASSHFNTGNSHSLTPSAGGSFNSGYNQNSVPQISNHIDTAYRLPVSSSQNNGYAETTTAPFKVDLNPKLNFVASISSDNIQASTGSANVNVGYTQAGSNNNFNGIANSVSVPSSAPITPAVVFKHIYFHVPPPDVEERRVITPPPPPKKNYKILFIKVPSQESKSNLARLKQMAEMSNAAASVEHKTLIYVLVKSPQTQQPVVIPKRIPSEHEVFFVKYNGNPLDIAAQVNEELDKSGTVQSIVPLEPGLVNGKK